MPDDISRKVNEALSDAKKELGKVNDQLRARDRVYEIDTRTRQGQKEMLNLARKEISMFGRSEHFDKMIGALDMDYDRFVDHEMKNLRGNTPEGRSQLATMAGIERKEYGETERFRQMLDKGDITPAAFEYFDKNGELPGIKKDVSFKGRQERSDRTRENTLEKAYSVIGRGGDAGSISGMLKDAGITHQEFESYMKERLGGGHFRSYGVRPKDSASPSFGKSVEERAKTTELENAVKNGNKIAAENRAKELKAIQDKKNPSFGSLKSDAYYKTSELKRDLAAGREVAVHNRINELNDIGKKMAKEEQAKIEKKKKEELEKQKKAEAKKAAEKKAEEERKKKAAEEKKKAEEERKKKEAEEKRKKEEEERKKQQKK